MSEHLMKGDLPGAGDQVREELQGVGQKSHPKV